MIRRLSILALVALTLLAATAASAAYITAPDWVIATESGHFVTAMTVYAGAQGDAVIDAETLLGTVNCSEDRRRELDCGVVVPAGETYHFIYEGNLDDATADGMVELGVEFCGGQENLMATIEVLHFGTVGADEGSWDSLKASYR